MSSSGQTNSRRVSRARSAPKNRGVKKPRREYKTPAFVISSEDEQEPEISQTETNQSSADGLHLPKDPIKPSFKLPEFFPPTTSDLDELLEVLAETARPTSDPYFPLLTIDEVGELMEAFMETSPPIMETNTPMKTNPPTSHSARRDRDHTKLRLRKKPRGKQRYKTPASNSGLPPTTS